MIVYYDQCGRIVMRLSIAAIAEWYVRLGMELNNENTVLTQITRQKHLVPALTDYRVVLL